MDMGGVRPKIVLITTSSASLWVFFREQCQYLVQQGFEVSAICNDGPELAEFEHVTCCRVYTVPITRSVDLYQDLRSLVHIHTLLRRLNPDLVHCHTPKAGLLGTIASLTAGVKIRIHTFHGLRSETLTGFQRIVVEAAESLTARLATMSLAVSHSLRELLIARSIVKAAKLQVIGFGGCAGVDVQRFNKRDWHLHGRKFREQAGIEPDALVVTYIGRIARDKGLEVLAKAWSDVKAFHADARLCVTGPLDSTDPISPERMRELRKDPTVFLNCGFTDDVAPLLAATQVFVSPSFREGLGVAALEASAMEVPVVLSHVTGLKDAAEHGVTGFFVNPHDVAQLASAINALLQDRALGEEMGRNGRAFVERRFDRPTVFEGIVNFYKVRLLEHARGSSRRTIWGSASKRILDVFIAVLVLIVSSPILLLSIAAIRICMGAPIFFTQGRGGKNSRIFKVLKLRTMSADTVGDFNSDAARLTKLGSLLRKLSIDELPQLINVIRGEMSLVGPRPLLAEYLGRYTAEQARRHEVRPGITGWAQIQGRNHLSWQKKFEYDVWYVDHQSFGLDIRILLLTALHVLRPLGISAAGIATMTEFTGGNGCSNPTEI